MNFIDYINKYKCCKKGNLQEGFSLLELVVAVGILLVLSVGGLLAYNGITQRVKQVAVNNAAKTVYTKAVSNKAMPVVAPSNVGGNLFALRSAAPLSPTLPANPVVSGEVDQSAAQEWMKNSDGSIDVVIIQETESSICVVAKWVEDPTIAAREGDCTISDENNPPTSLTGDYYVWNVKTRIVENTENTESGYDTIGIRYDNDETGPATRDSDATVRITVQILNDNNNPEDRYEGNFEVIGGGFELVSVSDDGKTYVFESSTVRETAWLRYSWKSFSYEIEGVSTHRNQPRVAITMTSDNAQTTPDIVIPESSNGAAT